MFLFKNKHLFVVSLSALNLLDPQSFPSISNFPCISSLLSIQTFCCPFTFLLHSLLLLPWIHSLANYYYYNYLLLICYHHLNSTRPPTYLLPIRLLLPVPTTTHPHKKHTENVWLFFLIISIFPLHFHFHQPMYKQANTVYWSLSLSLSEWSQNVPHFFAITISHLFSLSAFIFLFLSPPQTSQPSPPKKPNTLCF